MMVGSNTDYVSSGGGGWGGFGGWGGGIGSGILGGILGGALFGGGLFGRRDGFDGRRDGCGDHCCEKELELINDNMNSRFNSVEAKQNAQQIEGQIGALGTRMDVFKDFTLTAFGDLKRENALLGKDVVISEKNIIHDIDKCCCENLRSGDAHFAALQHGADMNTCKIITNNDCNTQKILDRLCCMEKEGLENEIAELRERVREEKRENDLFRMANVVATSVKATTVGSNFNTGTQSSSNNSGQING